MACAGSASGQSLVLARLGLSEAALGIPNPGPLVA